jgi:hypothetical protein
LKAYLGPPKTTPIRIQNMRLGKIKAVLKRKLRQGWLRMQLDEATFVPKSQKMVTWAPSSKPLSAQYRWTSGVYVSVMAAISKEHGLEMTKFKQGKGFNKEDFVDFLKSV